MVSRVFLCEPSGLTATQRLKSDEWHERLFGFGFDVDQVRQQSYAPDPWPVLRTRIECADGVIVLGFRQLFVSAGSWRPATQVGTAIRGAAWSSPWLHIEAGLAIAFGRPVLIAPEDGVTEGIFATGTWSGALSGTSMDSPNAEVLEAWACSVHTAAATRAHIALTSE
jgi:hypothetical protein